MKIKCKDIFNLLEKIAPLKLSMEWDNVGHLIGDSNKEVKNILLSLDIDDDVIKEAIYKNVDLIINHHPLIFKSINRINTDTLLGRRIIKLIERGISVYCLHTNLDVSNYGTNDKLFDILGLKDKEHFYPVDSEGFSLGRVGYLEDEISLKNFTILVKRKLGLNFIRYVGLNDKSIKKIALCTGSGSSEKMFLLAKEKNCDVFITGDIKFHDAQIALGLDLCLIDGSHYGTENIINGYIKDYLSNKLYSKDINIFISEINGEVFKNI